MTNLKLSYLINECSKLAFLHVQLRQKGACEGFFAKSWKDEYETLQPNAKLYLCCCPKVLALVSLFSYSSCILKCLVWINCS